MRKTLKRWNDLRDFIEILAWTAFAENGRPQSIFMIAEPGQGKTELLELFRPNPQLAFYSDITYRAVIDVLKMVKRGKVTHLVVTEFQKVIMRRKHIAESTLTILLQAMEEGVYQVSFGPQSHDLGGARLGVIAATTTTSLSRNPFLVTELAMDSRSYFVDASGSRDELMEIERRIAAGDMSSLKPIVMRGMPDKPVKVIIPPTLAEKVRGWVREMEHKKINTYGVRTYTKFLHTLRGIPLRDGRDRVTRNDFDELYAYKRFWLEPPILPEAASADTAGLGDGPRGKD